MSRFGDAAYSWMTKHKLTSVSSNELWRGLEQMYPELTAKTPNRKTPRTTFGRDLLKDRRFQVSDRNVSLI